MVSSTSPREFRDAYEPKRTLALWVGVLAGPIVWLALLEANYVMSYVACEMRQTWFLHVATGIAVAVVAAAGGWAWIAGRRPRDFSDPLADPVSLETREARSRWMTHVAVVSSIWFIIVILAMEVPVIVLRTCQ